MPDGEPGLRAFRNVELVAGLDHLRSEDVGVAGLEVVDQRVVQVVNLRETIKYRSCVKRVAPNLISKSTQTLITSPASTK